MFDATVAQLRLASSLATGRRLNLRALEKVTDAMCATVAEFGSVSGDAAQAFSGPVLDDDVREDVVLRRMRTQVRRAVEGTSHYAALGLDAGELRTFDDIARLALTRKESLRADPSGFVRRGCSAAARVTTTGTTGRTTTVHYSDYELRVIAALTTNHLALRRLIGPGDVVAQCISSRATLAVGSVTSSCRSLGAVAELIGLVEPREALDALARGRATVLNIYASYLGALVEHGRRLGYGPRDFALERILVGGEIVTAGLLRRARELFGDVEVAENCAMTEIAPAGGTPCSHDHLHLEPTTGLIEVLSLDDERPAVAGEPGTLVVTPLPPYRETTLLLRYDTEDVVAPLAGPLHCELRHLPAVTRIMGKRRLAVRHDDGWTFQRLVQEALEQLDAVPLPARYGIWPAARGVGVETLVRHDDAATRRAVRDALDGAGVPVGELRMTEDARDLRYPMPLRADLREHSFAGSGGGS
jgi:phenylacetate-coenzyme A ligase PaaK-like adenylate-forming protein